MIVSHFTITPDSVQCPWAPGATAMVWFAVDKEINSTSTGMQSTAVLADWWAARTSETVAAQNATGFNVTLTSYDVEPGVGVADIYATATANFRYVEFKFTVPLDTIFPGGCDDPPVTIELLDARGAPFGVEATVTISPALVAVDDFATTPADTPVAVDVLANDTLNGDPVSIGDLAGPPTVVAAPSSGTAVWNPATNSFDYTPAPGFCGTDTFEYEIAGAPFTFVAGPGQIQVAAPQGSTVNWGDGSPLETTGAGAGVLQHTYATAGPHVGTIEQQPGAFNRHIAGGALLEVVRWGAEPLLGTFAFFGNAAAPNLTAVPSTAPPGTTNMTRMFNGATSFNQPIGGWDVGIVANMANMFYGATSFNQPIGAWDVGNVTDMSNMFRSSVFNQDIGGWDVGNVTNMTYMFNGATSFNQDISGWDVGNVTNMANMFYTATSFNQPIGGWDVGNVANMAEMFFASSFNQDISGWDVSNVTNMSGMFRSSVFNQDIGGWDVGNVTDMTYMFNGAASFNQDLSGWCVENIASAPFAFDLNTPAWALPKPDWGAPC